MKALPCIIIEQKMDGTEVSRRDHQVMARWSRHAHNHHLGPTSVSYPVFLNEPVILRFKKEDGLYVMRVIHLEKEPA